jgi:hypothetical protein
MKYNNTNFSTSEYSGKIVYATMMLMFVLVILVVFISFSDRASAFGRYEKMESTLNALGDLKSMVIKQKAGVMNGIIYNPPSSSAIVDQTIVHEGDKIHDVAVVAIHNNAVEFAKNGVAWQQNVFSQPNAVWTAKAK